MSDLTFNPADMNPQDMADFSKLQCWVLGGGVSVTTTQLLEGLSLQHQHVEAPKGFKAKVMALVFGPHGQLPKGAYPHVVVVEDASAKALGQYIKQQNPDTFVISYLNSNSYTDLTIPQAPQHFEMVLGSVRGHLLRHVTLS